MRIQPIYFTFKLGDLPLALGQRTRRVRDTVDLAYQPFSQHVRLNQGQQCVQPRRPLHCDRFTRTNPANVGVGRRST